MRARDIALTVGVVVGSFILFFVVGIFYPSGLEYVFIAAWSYYIVEVIMGTESLFEWAKTYPAKFSVLFLGIVASSLFAESYVHLLLPSFASAGYWWNITLQSFASVFSVVGIISLKKYRERLRRGLL